MARLWQETVIEDEPVRLVTVLTTEPNVVVESIHYHMPVVMRVQGERMDYSMILSSGKSSVGRGLVAIWMRMKSQSSLIIQTMTMRE